MAENVTAFLPALMAKRYNGSRFYSYKGLRSFKAKYDPQWHGI
jgi:lysylphosphatidylglycerol synthetase-like protein (DUF2156 family)